MLEFIRIFFTILFLSIGVLYTIHNTYEAWCKNTILGPQIILQAIGIVGFITLMWLI